MEIEKLTTRELLDFREIVEILYAHYDNEAKANAAESALDEDKARAFEAARKESLKYLSLKEKIFYIMKNRADSLV